MDKSEKQKIGSQLMAIVSHDLRNPLNAIVLNSKLIEQDLPPGEAGNRIRKRLSNINKLAFSMSRLVTHILDVENIEHGNLPVNKAPNAVVDVLSEAVNSTLLIASERKIKIDADLPDASVMAYFDYDRISQVLSNLIGNAIKFTPEGGSIIISSHVDQHNDVIFCVTNTGSSIPEEKRDTIFENFTQLHPEEHKGLGLGLYICKSIVEAHNGRIWVAATDGDKTTFCFSIPKVG